MKWLRFFLSHSIFIAICADALCFQTALVLHFKLPVSFYWFIFFSTVCSYNFYWLLSGFYFDYNNRHVFFRKYLSNIIVFVFSFTGTLYTVYFVRQQILLIILGVLLTLLYCLPLVPFKMFNFSRKGGLLKTLLLAFTWTFVTVYIPYQYLHTQNETAL